MRHITPIIATLTACLLASCSGSRHSASSKLPGNWQAQPIVVDGDSKDWPSPYPNYDSKAMVAYATSNDKDNLYVTVETGDEVTQMKILRAGMVVWIDTTLGKNQTMNIHYPLPDDNEPFEAQKEDAESSPRSQADIRHKQRSARIKKAVTDATQFTLEGFGPCDGGFAVSQGSKCGVQVRMSIDEWGELVWEASIPFKVIYGKDQITAADAGRPIGVCFALKGLKRPAPKDNGGGAGGNAGGMSGGGMRGGGMHGGRGGGRSGQSSSIDNLFESTHTWKQFGLAYQ